MREALTVSQACARLSISRSTFYRLPLEALAREGVVARIPPGTGALRVDVDALWAWLRRTGRRADAGHPATP
ncbi:MAG: hypothetical protein AB7N76_09655 [Planctomycetota bacterium]